MVDKEGTSRLEELEEENARLRAEVAQLCGGINLATRPHTSAVSGGQCEPLAKVETLSAEHISRYSRQLLVPSFGVEPQRKLLSSSVLVLGAGGLGSSVLLYLAAAGVGRLGIVDMDAVDNSNLHRQVIHNEARQGMNKAESARASVLAVNSSVHCVAHACAFSGSNGLSLVQPYDLVVDASDNPRTRYMVSDACVLGGRKPLVGGAALGIEGNVTVYIHGDAPCYRCVLPRPFAAEASRSCSDNGVLGPVPGLMGVLQAMEAIKVLTGTGRPLTGRMVMYDAMDASFRTLKLPPRSRSCAVCGGAPTIRTLADTDAWTSEHGLGGEGVQACAINTLPKLPPGHEVSCQDYHAVRSSGAQHVLLDVREPLQYAICRLDGAISVPLRQLKKRLSGAVEGAGGEAVPNDVPVYVMCRRGIASTHATQLLLDHGYSNVVNVRGGLTEWHECVDRDFPLY